MTTIAKGIVRIDGKDNTQKAFKSAEGRVKRFSSSLKALVGVYAVLSSTKWIVKQADEYKLLNARLEKASKGLGSFKDNYNDLYAIAGKTGSAFSDSVKLFESLARTAPDIGATRDHVLQMTESLQMMAVTSGATGEEIKNSMRQFSQAMAGGIVRAEEFNSIIENTPEIAAKIAEGMGMTVGQLRMAVVEGKVLSKDVFESILGQTEQIESDFAKMPMTMDRAFTMMGNSAQKLIGVTMEALGGPISLISEAIADVAGWIDDLSSSVSDGTIVSGFKQWEAPLKTAYGWLISFGNAVLKFVAPAFAILGDTIQGIGNMIKDIPWIVEVLAIKITAAFFKAWASTETAFKVMVNKLKIIWAKFKQFFLNKWREAVEGMIGMLDGLPTNMFDGISKSMQSSVDDMEKTLAGYTEEIKTNIIANENLNSQLESQIETYDQIKDEMEKESKAKRDSAWASKEATTALEEQSKELKALGTELTGVNVATDEFIKHWDAFSTSVKGSWTNMFEDIFTGGDAIESVSDFLKTVEDMFLKTLAKIAAQWTWTKLFGNLGDNGGELGGIIGTALKAGISKATGGMDLKTIFGSIGKIFTGGGKIGSAVNPAFASSGELVMGSAGGAQTVGGAAAAGAGTAGTSWTAGITAPGASAGGGMAGMAGFAAPLAIFGFGMMKSMKDAKKNKAEYDAILADTVMKEKMASEEITKGYVTLGEKGGQTYAQLSGDMAKHMEQVYGNVDAINGNTDAYGNMIVKVTEFDDFMKDLKWQEMTVGHKESIEELNGAYGQLGVTGQEATLRIDMAMKAVIDQEKEAKIYAEIMEAGFVSAAQALELGMPKAANKSAEEFQNMVNSANAAQNGVANLSADGINRLAALDASSVQVARHLEDNMVTASEASALGFRGLSEMSSEMFLSMIEYAKQASEGMNDLARAANNAGSAANQARQSGAGIPGYMTGGSFMVGGQGGLDNNIVAFKASNNERVTVETPQQQAVNNRGQQSSDNMTADLIEFVTKPLIKEMRKQSIIQASNERH